MVHQKNKNNNQAPGIKYRNNHVKELTNKLELDVRTEDGARLFCCDG